MFTTTIQWSYTLYTTDSVPEWLHEHETVLIAEEGREVVGVAAFYWFRDAMKRPGYRFTVENTIHVREDQWRSNVGRKLMRALLQEARAIGKHTMITAINSANEGSIRFHEQLGFLEVPRMPEVPTKFGKWLHLVLHQLRLDNRTIPGRGLTWWFQETAARHFSGRCSASSNSRHCNNRLLTTLRRHHFPGLDSGLAEAAFPTPTLYMPDACRNICREIFSRVRYSGSPCAVSFSACG